MPAHREGAAAPPMFSSREWLSGAGLQRRYCAEPGPVGADR